MKSNPTTLIVTTLGLIIALVGIDLGRHYLSARADQPPPPDPNESKDPAFKVGDLAPDFTLKEKNGVPRTLSHEVKGDTMLAFICGCSACRQMHAWLGKLQQKMGDRAPKVFTVSTADPAAEEAWIRDTGLKQTIVYDDQKNPPDQSKTVATIYKTHPCPRLYRLNPDRTVAWIGPSPIQDAPLDYMEKQAAAVWGYQPPDGKDPNKPKAPPLDYGLPGMPMVKPVNAPTAPGLGRKQSADTKLPPYLQKSPYENQ